MANPTLAAEVDGASRLLYVLSARREMSWRIFKEVFDALWLGDRASTEVPAPESEDEADEREGGFARRHTATVLDALGHCDFDWSQAGGRVFVGPAVLARLPRAGLPQAVLCGARSLETRVQVEKACALHGATVEWRAQKSSVAFVPPRVVVEAASVAVLEAVARDLNITVLSEPAAWQILHAAPNLETTLAACRWGMVSDLNWRRRDFDPRTLTFWEGVRAPASEGALHLIRYTHPRRQTSLHFLWRDGQLAEADLDWGRYAVLNSIGRSLLFYDPRSYGLATPASAPLPPLLARSLALCSGHAPLFVPRRNVPWPSPERRGFNVYRAIPEQIATMVASKLGQVLGRQEIKIGQ
jgi:hypothetical protein